MCGKFLAAFLVFVAIVGLCVLPFLIPADRAPQEQGASSKEVKVYDASGRRWVSWPSTDAVKFSFDQLVATIRYLFAAAAAGMAFVGKIVIEPRATSAGAATFSRPVHYILVATIVIWTSSLISGMIAHLCLVEVSTSEFVSIYGQIGVYVLFQLIYFASGLLLFLIGLVFAS